MTASRTGSGPPRPAAWTPSSTPTATGTSSWPSPSAVKTDGGTAAGPGAKVLAELAGLIADGHLEVPIANVYPLAQVREAYTELERRHTRGKIVLRP